MTYLTCIYILIECQAFVGKQLVTGTSTISITFIIILSITNGPKMATTLLTDPQHWNWILFMTFCHHVIELAYINPPSHDITCIPSFSWWHLHHCNYNIAPTWSTAKLTIYYSPSQRESIVCYDMCYSLKPQHVFISLEEKPLDISDGSSYLALLSPQPD